MLNNLDKTFMHTMKIVSCLKNYLSLINLIKKKTEFNILEIKKIISAD